MIHDLKRRSAQAVEQYHAILDEEDARQGTPAKERPDSVVILGQLFLEASLTSVERKKLVRAPGLSVLGEAPSDTVCQGRSHTRTLRTGAIVAGGGRH